MRHKSSCLDYLKDFASKNNKNLSYSRQKELHYLFRTRLRLQQLMHRCNNKNQCLRKKLHRRRQVEVEVEVGEGEEEEEEEEVAVGEQQEKIDAKHHYLLHKY